MKKTLLVAAGLSLLAVGTARAQTTCNGVIPANSDSAAANAKIQASDLFQFLAPQLGMALAGGNTTLGSTSTLGGLGHFSVGARGTVLRGAVPDVANFPKCYTNAVRSTLPTTSAPIGLPAADAAIGIFGGLPLGLTNIGGIDLLVSASYIPEFDRSGVRVKLPDGSLQLGYGARFGLLSESILVPGVSLSYLRRDLPRVNMSAVNGSDSLLVSGLKLKTTSLRLVASKSLVLFTVAGGVGQDRFEARVDTVRANVGAPAPIGRAQGSLTAQVQTLTRTNYFLDLSLNLLMLNLTGEIGQSTGGTVSTFNSFQGDKPESSRTYASLGVRFGL